MKASIFALTIFLLFEITYANEAPPPAAEGKKAQTSVGGKGGDKGLPPWFQTEARIGELVAKVKAKEDSLEKLIQVKKSLKEGAPQTKSTIEQIVKEHKELEELVGEYNKNLNLLKYRFPERGMKMERNYKKKEVQSVDNIEQAIGIDTKLSRSLNKARTQFGSSPDSSKEKSKKRSVVATPQEKTSPKESDDSKQALDEAETDPNKMPIDEQPALVISK
jgi:hypothetical protein